MAKDPTWDLTNNGCASLSEIQPIPKFPSNSSISFSNLVRNGEF